MSLDFNWTCPDIDSGIKSLKDLIDDTLDDLLSEVSPLFEGESKRELIKKHIDYLYANGIEDIFETVRETNSDMRTHADKQIGEVLQEKFEAEEQLEEKK